MVPKILMFGWEFPPYNSGGLGTACLGLTRALSKEDVSVTFVLPKTIPVEGDTKMVFADEGGKQSIKFRAIDTILAPYVNSETYREGTSVQHLSLPKDHYGTTLIDEVKRYALRARAIALQEDFDVIHAHDWLSFLAGLEAKRATGKPLVIHVHATEMDRTGGNGVNQLIYDIERHVMHNADVIIAVSELTKNQIVNHYGVSPESVQVIHNGIDLDEEESQTDTTLQELKEQNTKIVLYLGRVTVQKGPDYFLEAARKVIDVYEGDVVFVLNGTGDMHDDMVMKAASLGIGDKVLFSQGFGKQAMKLFASADLYVMPSVSEPFGLTPLESISQGTPVLISKQSGVSEVLTHALKVDFWDTNDMANKIIGVLEHGSLGQTLLENSKQEVRGITWEKAAHKCVNIYNKLAFR